MAKKLARQAAIRHLAELRLPPGAFVVYALGEVKAFMDAHASAFFWLDGEGQITNCWSDRIPGVAREEQQITPEDSGRRPQLRFTSRFGTASRRFWSDVIAANSGRHQAYSELVGEEGVCGVIGVCRTASQGPFRASEVEELHSVSRYFVRGLRDADGAFDLAYQILDSDIVVCHPSGEIVDATDRCKTHLAMACGARIAPDTIGALPDQVRGLLSRACEIASSRTRDISQTTFWGTFILRAHSLRDTHARPLFAVQIERHSPRVLDLLRLLREANLAPQQQQIALLIAQQKTNRDISVQLGISLNTVAYHVRQIFSRLGIHDRVGLIVHALGRRSVEMPPPLRPLTSISAKRRRGEPAELRPINSPVPGDCRDRGLQAFWASSD